MGISMHKKHSSAQGLAVLAGAMMAGSLWAQGTGFTYQGELRESGSVVTGGADLSFRLFDAAAAGQQIGVTLCADDVIIVDGRFIVTLDFGDVFPAGVER